MNIRISKKHSVEHKSGYWIYPVHAITEKTCVEYKSQAKTYAKMLDMWHNLKLAGGCGEDIMKAVQELLIGAQKEAGRFILNKREAKLNE